MKEIPITSFRNLKIGQAENTAAGTGCTVFLLGQEGAPAGMYAAAGLPPARASCSSRWRRRRSSTPLCWRGAVPLDWTQPAVLCGILRSAASVLMLG